MTFESMIENTPVANENTPVVANENATLQPAIVNEAEALAVKVSYGDELRRATFNGVEYVQLRDICARLFELNPETTVLRYQDDDGDKVTMSTNGELQEALSLAKEKKILRLFVDVKAPVNPPTPAAAEEESANADAQCPFPQWRRGPFPMRGGFPHRGHWNHGGHPFGARGGPFHYGPHAAHHGPHAAHHGPHGGHAGHGPHGGPHAVHHGPYGGPHAFYNHGQFSDNTPVQTEQVQAPFQAGVPTATFNIPRMHAHGVFTPADAAGHAHPASFSPYARHAFKMHKHAMKEQIKRMKINAVTEEDHQAIKDFKDQVRAECKARWQEVKAEKKACKSDKKAWKAEKSQWKEDTKCEKNDKLMARHVADITIPDNSELPADTPVTKTWRLRNAGILAWPADSQLIFVSRRGDNLNGPERVLVGQAVEPNQEVDVSVTFITPSESGRYIGYYRMATADGTKFGQRVWVSFIIPTAAKNVEMPETAAPETAVPEPTAPVDPTVPLIPSSPVASAPKAPEAADDITMD